MKDLTKKEYISQTERIYKMYPKIRLTDSQLAKIFVKEYGGVEAARLSAIRRSRCNDKKQPYVSENL